MDDFDVWLLRALYGGDRPSGLTEVMLGLSAIGSGWVLLLLVPLVVWRKSRGLAFALGAAIAVQLVLVWALKLAVHRVRPCNALDLHPVCTRPLDFSFPSGHAAGSFTVGAFLAGVCLSNPSLRARHALAAAALLLAGGVTISRVYLGVHYPSDVTGGAVLGALIGAYVARWHVARTRAPTEDAPRIRQL